MDQVMIAQFASHVGREVEVRGWLYNRRSKGKIHFLQIRDGSGIVQAVMARQDFDEATFELAGRLPQESSVIVRGVVKEDARAPGGFELMPTSFTVVHEAEPYPIALQEHGPDFLLTHRHLWLRSKKQAAIMRIRSRVVSAIRNYFDERGFVLLDTPMFTPAACEGTTTLFEVKYFDDQAAYLTQSGQLYAEAGAMALGKVYCFGPVFRAEKSKTRRHLTEFWMVEPEVAYATLDDMMDLSEGLLLAAIEAVLNHHGNDLADLERDPLALRRIKGPFPRISYHEAHRILTELGTGHKLGDDFGAPDETALGNHFGQPTFVHRWPAEIKAFYMKRDPENENLVLGVDLIGPEGAGELVGGSQREDDLDLLLSRIRHENLPEEAFQWYVDLRRYGSVPHAGFGMGLERVLSWICGREHIRECIPFPRMLNRIYP
ncbi:MAG TPA: asparagine--tRNA ligase [Planctomycetota bacterium]|nr:asparagine--tRNA ligase [Planctomycetota bacterium]